MRLVPEPAGSTTLLRIKKAMLCAAIFDFDLTLADSSRGVTECINFALGRLGYPIISQECARTTIGLSLQETFSTLTGRLDESLASAFAGYFVQRADEVMESLTTLYPAVPRTVKILRKNGMVLAIVSTKFRYRIRNILNRYRLLDQFSLIVGGEDVTAHKPDPAGLLLALDRLALRSDEVVYIGDHIVDAQAAAGAGLQFIGVLTGSCKREDFASSQDVILIDSMGDLPACLKLAGQPGTS